ncbi:glycoside hydrolase family 3 N-terminal domain-containing protein [Thalassomonas sp. M1454]|uniref:glycoside hydrolase family 3 N-terminal domain-containing protein n=1 Tax=Thalassomonas sp. M1454 TaxID=2594477 RepID=UPI00117F2E63|nr:glycoside hydrolase family 3 N-terminal domain-containing protein [Thalassomonas sp. M1454]TRX53949.1 beta-glucosidase [Thalassomonas sp. M1454]
MKYKNALPLTAALASLSMLCMPVVAADLLPYQDKNLSAEERVDDLISRMTLREKAGQMSQFVGLEHIKESESKLTAEQLNSSDAHGFYPGLRPADLLAMVEKSEIGSFLHVVNIEEANELQKHAMKSRLGIPLIIGIDAIHGNALVRGATVYPSPISAASSFNLDLVKKSSVETAKEMRANGSHWTFTPNVDVVRDPRWGRVGETFGEDPFLVAKMGVATVEGLQQTDFTGYDKVIANAKHFVGGGDSINGLNIAPLDVSERTLRQDYFPPFKEVLDAGVFTVMAAHNEVNGVPSHGSKFLLTDVLRGEWDFPGFVVSDWLDVDRLKTLHKVVPTHKDAVHLTVDSGMDMNMHGPQFAGPIIELVEEGRLTEARIDASVKPILLAKFRLGLFDNPYVDETLRDKVNFNSEHQQTALAMARESIVLLKNDNNVLPLKNVKNIFVTGPNADAHTTLGDWSLEQPEDNVTTILEGLQQVSGNKIKLDYLDVGKQVKVLSDEQITEAAKRAKSADVSIVVVGENPLRFDNEGKTSGENVARAELDLYGRQLELIKAVHAAGKPVIVVLINGRPISEPWLSENVDAIVEAWEPGSFGGQAVAEILYGKVNPSAKMPISVPYSVGHIQSIYNHKPSTYFKRYVDSPTKNLYEFGFGLSYSTFTYSELSLDKNSINKDGSATVTVKVTNTSDVAGDEVVQLYINDNYSQVTRPVKELKGFKRVSLGANESKKVSFTVTPDLLAYYNLAMQWGVESGDFTLMVGSSSRDSDLKTIQLNVK